MGVICLLHERSCLPKGFSSNLSSCPLFTDTCSSCAASWSSNFIHWWNLYILCPVLSAALSMMLATMIDYPSNEYVQLMCYPFSGNMLAYRKGSYSSNSSLWRAGHWGRLGSPSVAFDCIRQLLILSIFRYQFEEHTAPLPIIATFVLSQIILLPNAAVRRARERCDLPRMPLLSVLTVSAVAQVTHEPHMSSKYCKAQF